MFARIFNLITQTQHLSAMPGTPEIFISYAWGKDLEAIVNKLYDTLVSKNYNVVRDKVNLGYKGNIRDFMQRLGGGSAIIIVISKKYLESHNCMFEALQIKEQGDLERRIFPIVLSDANIYNIITRLQYCKYWDDKIIELQDAIKSMTDLGYLQTTTGELNLYKDIRRFIDEFTGIVQNMNALTPEMHQDADFEALTDALDELFAQDARSPTPSAAPHSTQSTPLATPRQSDYTALKTEVRELIGRARLEDAIRTFREKSGNAMADDIAELERKLTEAKKGEMRGLLDFSEVGKIKSQVSFALMGYLDQL